MPAPVVLLRGNTYRGGEACRGGRRPRARRASRAPAHDGLFFYSRPSTAPEMDSSSTLTKKTASELNDARRRSTRDADPEMVEEREIMPV